MKLISYKYKGVIGSYRTGLLYEEGVIDLQESYRSMLLHEEEKELVNIVDTLLPHTPDDFFKLGLIGIHRAKEVDMYMKDQHITNLFISRKDIRLGAPVPNPSKIICVGKNYKDHVAEMKSDIPEYPVLFAKFNNALIGPEDDIEKSSMTNKLDYEVELAIIIGKEATSINEDEALDYVAGYTIGNDVSARDLQKRTPQWLQGKSLDRSTPVGPWIVTTDELTNPSNLNVKTLINGEVRQSSNTKHLIFSVPFIISFISNLITLEPGDIILTGTPDGVGMAMNPPCFLQAGDNISMEIENIGTLENTVVNSRK
ncbi:fumarylacetoacetate hydrolase family protein [Aquibacillus rhizosphaerae]|uniref:Fumarylacetoacetate hydrolase family protein n=1 Tax=Aquibacillus rhizosphaerae TaxID=3051431 RepID=A0ABT7L139_9BACI|nr:fumarylacetoacetate hydrolase family protein [Aquibacillus sp. LR5S19]MDL4839518.1 fumarylacetoacetate hydrolase family protein [Aquibacillus sp. LR5S19]